jgi:hypothetical protein
MGRWRFWYVAVLGDLANRSTLIGAEGFSPDASH